MEQPVYAKQTLNCFAKSDLKRLLNALFQTVVVILNFNLWFSGCHGPLISTRSTPTQGHKIQRLKRHSIPMTTTRYDEFLDKANQLKKQSKKHQIFREALLEATKLAEAGLLHLRAAAELPEEERAQDFKEAATCLSRSKRLSRALTKESKDG